MRVNTTDPIMGSPDSPGLVPLYIWPVQEEQPLASLSRIMPSPMPLNLTVAPVASDNLTGGWEDVFRTLVVAIERAEVRLLAGVDTPSGAC